MPRAEIEETARELFYRLTDGIPKPDPLAHRNAKAICLLIATLQHQGLVTTVAADDLISDALS